MKTKLLCGVLVCLLSLSFAGTCSAGEYRITEGQVTRFETIFQQLELNNKMQLSELETLKTSLLTDEQKLQGYQKELDLSQTRFEIANQELKKALIDLKQAQTSLQKANESLDKYEKEVKQEIRKVTWQRNLWEMIGIAALARSGG